MSSPTSELLRSSRASSSLYDQDGYAWAQQQAEALRRRNLDAIDWDNVIEEIESVGRAERRSWVSNCARAIEHMLVIEHWKTATAGDVKHWRKEIGAFRRGMAAAIEDNPSLQGEYGETYSKAWKIGRREAVDRLTEYSAEAAGAEDPGPFERVVRAKLPASCPYLIEHVAAYDPKRDEEPQSDVWPPGVAAHLNAALGTNYEIHRGPSRGRGWSR